MITRAVTSSRSDFPRVALVNSRGEQLRYIPGAAARLMVEAGVASPRAGPGRIREVQISQPASSFAHRIGEASAPIPAGVCFYRRVKLETARIVEHHPRALY